MTDSKISRDGQDVAHDIEDVARDLAIHIHDNAYPMTITRYIKYVRNAQHTNRKRF